ncbi:MAG: arginine repressor [Phycisphaerales bacterium]|nr:arginine repressor [Phycisphaerales bacterium]
MSGKPARHHRIRELISGGRIDSQDRLQSALRHDGIEVTQATLSRDLRELGVLKGSQGYVMAPAAELGPARPAGTVERAGHGGLRRALDAFAVSIRHGGTLVIIRTGPGQAAPMALELDRSGLDGVLGTVAGDDTVFIAMGTIAEAGKLARELTKRPSRP